VIVAVPAPTAVTVKLAPDDELSSRTLVAVPDAGETVATAVLLDCALIVPV